MKRIAFVLVFAVTLTWLSAKSYGIDSSSLSELVGYTIVASTNATGEFEGADFDKLVKLDNGMIFEFHEYDYFYEYNPDVIVFAKNITLPDGRTFTDYKLVISDDDEVFDVTRIR